MNQEDALKSLVWEHTLPDGWERDIAMRAYRNPEGAIITDREVRQARFPYTCAVCGHGPDLDIRHITIECFYAVDEVSPKFVDDGKGYTIRVCKGCRARFLFHHLATFIDEKGRLAVSNLDSDGIVTLGVTNGPKGIALPEGWKGKETKG